jgi:hypothetical protein
MDKHLTVYPISTGDQLNVFATEELSCIRVMDMGGNVLTITDDVHGKHDIMDIGNLPSATYIVEVTFLDRRTCRSVFVKM